MTDKSQPGRLVGGRYRLVDRLGAGGMGRVWRAHDQTLGIDVAIKEVSLPFMLSEEQLAERLRRAEREARNTARLRDQPGIVTVHDVVIDDDAPWIVMQLVSGMSLDEHLREHGPLSVANTAKVADTMLRALDAAHAAGIIHRDVKPANVLLAEDGRVLLTDFGIARYENDTSLTMTGAVVGSAEYLAPERARAEEAGPASDLFSLGVTLYQAVEGVSPFRRDSPTATMTAVLFEQPAPPKNAERLTALLAGLLAKNPAQRPTVQAALAMLNGTAPTGASPAVTIASIPTPPTPFIPPTRALTDQASAQGSPSYPPNPTPYLANPTLGPPPRNGNGLKIALGVLAVVAISALATFGVTQLMHSSKSPQAGPGTSTSTTSGTGPTTATTPTAPAVSGNVPNSDGSQNPTTSATTSSGPPSPAGTKAGCTQAIADVSAFNKSNPAGTNDKDIEIQADHDLATKLNADAAMATDPTVQSAIQNLAGSWDTFATDYSNGDTLGMSQTIPQTTKDFTALNSACNS
ncbi:serine/threonine protein kinase [Catenulispora sp. NF23]|uniref:serine/threonine-protein kinase n=1 Tax=Catenulispora pinistramenti TaxID=2705254 RepID=UPI001BA7A6FE|nr:serine/threonine-protein kinase [Catenulispora pinistramenti]MBS2537464.1 serine/threonine protein kinase [Catenulispora pinistramenti]